jgi:quercetin dioxygenase-like cupin family protein
MPHTPKAVIRSIDSVEAVSVPRCRGTTIQVVMGTEVGAPNFDTRHFALEPGGRIPCHRHDGIEHEQVVPEGQMVLGLNDQEVEVGPGDCVLIPAKVPHWYENRGSTPVRFLCVVPRQVDYQTEWLEGPAE